MSAPGPSHPSWCDPAQCNASDADGAHRSARAVVDDAAVTRLEVFLRRPEGPAARVWPVEVVIEMYFPGDSEPEGLVMATVDQAPKVAAALVEVANIARQATGRGDDRQ